MKTRTRKDVIKNIAIVFLAIMLVLTFFSNTILNWSLPQVNGKYTEYGEIKTGVRGSGTVVSNMTYTESIKGNRTVEMVYVNRGSQVEAGQVLMSLSVSDSDSIEALKAEIATLQETYDRAILGRTENDYTSDEIAIRNAEEDLAEIMEERALFTDEYVAQVKADAEKAKQELEKAEERVEALEERLAEISENSDDPEIVAAREAVAEQTAICEAAQLEYELAQKLLEDVSYTDTDSLKSQRTALNNQLDSLEKELEYLEEDYADLLSLDADLSAKKTALEQATATYDKALEDYEANPDGDGLLDALNLAQTAKDNAQTEYDATKTLWDDKEEDIKEAKRTIEAKKSEISGVKSQISSVSSRLSSANSSNRKYNERKEAVELKKATVDDENRVLEGKKKTLQATVNKLNKTIAEELKTEKKALEDLTEQKAEADAKLQELSKIESLDDQIKSSQRSLESMKLSLEKRKESDAKADQLEDYDLNKQLKTIKEKKDKLAKLQGDAKESYDLCATHSGTVTEVNFRAGEIASDGAAAVVIEVQESGYSLSFSVSNTEALKVKVGDTATVSDTYWGQNVGAVLKSIVPDAGGKTRTLNFELDGNVNVGQTLTLLVGERTTGYSSVIPKSALREDSKGKFVYITKTKSTPLGNRYVATRLDVTVAAEDDKNVAIVTDESYLYEYVIVSSTKPFEEGGYVRLSD
ncbi:MAG: HlyD family efflux transporter periplasmic adaptor subunit [Clostridia bacterium]|nr:HlyD family efflux transporter periplasmic adaptor subunit [Clostridia bacterium]